MNVPAAGGLAACALTLIVGANLPMGAEGLARAARPSGLPGRKCAAFLAELKTEELLDLGPDGQAEDYEDEDEDRQDRREAQAG